MHCRPPTPVLACLAAAAVLAAISGCGSGSARATASASDGEVADSTAGQSDPDAPAKKTQPQPRPKLLPGAKTKVLAAAGDRPYDKTFDDLRFETRLEVPFRRQMLTDSIEAMFGQRIRIRGYMLPTAQKSGIKEFVLVRDNQECCFGPGAALYDCIFVQMKPGETTEFSIRPVAVAGTFDFHEIVVDGRHWAIYHLDGESVR